MLANVTSPANVDELLATAYNFIWRPGAWMLLNFLSGPYL